MQFTWLVGTWLRRVEGTSESSLRAKNQGAHSQLSVPAKPTFPLPPVFLKPHLLGQEPGVAGPELDLTSPLVWLMWGEERGAQRKAQGSGRRGTCLSHFPVSLSSPQRFLKQKEPPKCPICIFHSVPVLCGTQQHYQIGTTPIVSVVVHIHHSFNAESLLHLNFCEGCTHMCTHCYSIWCYFP